MNDASGYLARYETCVETAIQLANTGPAMPIHKPPGSLIGSPLAVKQISDTWEGRKAMKLNQSAV